MHPESQPSGKVKKNLISAYYEIISYYDVCGLFRFKDENVITLGIIPGPKKPKYLMSFLKPIFDEISELNRRGFVVKKNDGVVYSGKVHLMCLTGDIPGIAAMMNHGGHQSRCGCRICLSAGERINNAMCYLNSGATRSLEELTSGRDVCVSSNNYVELFFSNFLLLRVSTCLVSHH